MASSAAKKRRTAERKARQKAAQQFLAGLVPGRGFAELDFDRLPQRGKQGVVEAHKAAKAGVKFKVRDAR